MFQASYFVAGVAQESTFGTILTRILNVIDNALSIGTGYEVTCRLTAPSTSMAFQYRSAVIELLKERLRECVPLVAPPISKSQLRLLKNEVLI
jgi:hypothetical protein